MPRGLCWCASTILFLILLCSLPGHAQVVDTSTGNRYQYWRSQVTWPEARAFAAAQGGTLVTLTSKAEQDFVVAHMPDGSNAYFIGATDEGHEGLWTWLSGEPWNFSNWGSFEPNNFDDAEHYALMDAAIGYRWNDVTDTRTAGFIVEWGDTLSLPVATVIYLGTSDGYCKTPRPLVAWHYRDTMSTPPQRVEISVLVEAGDGSWNPVWTSGEIFTTDTALQYGGPDLQDASIYRFQLRLHNGDHWGGLKSMNFRVHLPKVLAVPEAYDIDVALRVALPGDTIAVGPGLYEFAHLIATKEVCMVSTQGPSVTTLQFFPNTEYGILFEGAYGVVVDGFSVVASDCPVGFRLRNSTVTFRNMIVRDSRFGEAVVTAVDAGMITISRSVFANLYLGYGIIGPQTSSHGLEFANNTVCSVFGSALRGLTLGSQIQNNIFANCSVWAIDGAVAGVTERYNCFFGNGENRNSPGGPVSLDLTSLVSDPSIISAELAIFDLARLSPCINAGNPDPDFNDPDGSRNDIGAIPYRDSPMSLSTLLIDGRSRNLHALQNPPEFVWRYADGTDRSQQRFVRIQVGADVEWSEAELWDTGELPFEDTTLSYTGNALSRGVTYYIRVRTSSGVVTSAWHYSMFRLNRAPTAPTLTWPLDRWAFADATHFFSIHTGTDADGDSLWYCFEYYSDSLLTMLSRRDTVLDVIKGVYFSYIVPLDWAENSTIWWRVCTSDGYLHSAYTAPWAFGINRVQEVPNSTQLIYPTDSIRPITSLRPVFSWHVAKDPDPFQTASYRWQLSTSPDFMTTADSSLPDTAVRLPAALDPNTTHYWRVYSVDRTGEQTAPSTGSFVTYLPGDITGDRSVDITDIVHLVDFLFGDFVPPEDILRADVNGDCGIDIVDLTLLIDHIFIAMQPLGPACEQ